MLVQTNNATFAKSSQSMQQLNISRIRAIENNKWLVSVSTTGVSAVIDNEGQVVSITKQNNTAYLYDRVDIIDDESIAHRFGTLSSIVIILGFLGVYLGKRTYDS
jgi:apolipoprotein N-acyltransferase